MEFFTTYLDMQGFVFALTIGFIAGLIKGVVGFGLPTVLISGLSSIVSPQLALAALIFPTLCTNVLQAFRQGWRAVWASVRAFRVFLVTGAVTMTLAAQLVVKVPQHLLLLWIGLIVAGFALSQLLGLTLRFARSTRKVEAIAGAIAGGMGGMSGIWGPPTVAYLTATGAQKADQIRVQGVIYGLGAVLLVLAHWQSGLLNAQTAPLSVLMVVPALAGMVAGMRIQDRIDQAIFRKVTLYVLLFAGLNLVRRGLT